MPGRISELVVLGDEETVFGEPEAELEDLSPGFRTHGSLHETAIPLVISNARGNLPAADQLRYNLEMTRTR
jgi:phosphonoacetate hydrolase